ncbi:DUF885 domain-containing protein [bacterium]|nr:DUF885 domain-containing protein [bacterium]
MTAHLFTTSSSVAAKVQLLLLSLSVTMAQSYSPAFAQVQVIKMGRGDSQNRENVSQNREEASQQGDAAARAQYDSLVDQYFASAFAFAPSWGTQVGFHQYDKELEDLSLTALKNNEATLIEYRRKFSDPAFLRLPKAQRLDLSMVQANISASLLDLQELHSLNRDPDRYPSLIADSVFSLAKRNFAAVDERLVSVIGRIEKAPALLAAGRANIEPDKVPRIYAEVALEQLPGTIELFKTTIPAAFASANPVLKEKFEKANSKLIAELVSYQTFVKEKILPNARGQFAIGEAAYVKKLAFDEMEDEKLDVILANGYKELRRLQARFKQLAHEINPKVSALECFESIASEHPQPDKLVSSTANVLDRIAAFIEEKKIVTIPSKDRVTVAESPSFMRALTFASMDTPGPYEDTAKEAFYYVTPVESDWDKKRIEEHMRFFSYADLLNTSVHEAYPGHYVQFLWVKHAPSKVRKLLGCSSNAEGWAHYCEQLMIEQGLPAAAHESNYKDKKPEREKLEQEKLELVQIHDALLRVCRYIVGIEMHTRGLSYDNGREFFIKEGFMEKANAERETKRGTKDPTYLVYTLGKLKIIALKAEYMAKMGDKFDQRDFHDRFLKCGFPPLKIVRTEVLDLPSGN